jgi:hypothetical protein
MNPTLTTRFENGNAGRAALAVEVRPPSPFSMTSGERVGTGRLLIANISYELNVNSRTARQT